MTFKITKAVIALRATASDSALHPAGTVMFDDIVIKLGNADVAGWIRVRVLGSNPSREGFIHESDAAEQAVDTTIDEARFIIAVSQAARFAASNPFFLYALAAAESGIANTASTVAGSTATGPYRFTTRRWTDLTAKFKDTITLTDDDLLDPFKQVLVAALESGGAIKSLKTLLGRDAQANELYLMHILGDAPGTVVMAVSGAASDTPIDVALGPQLGTDGVRTALADHPAIFNRDDQTATIAQALGAAATALDPGLAKAATLKDQLAPAEEGDTGTALVAAGAQLGIEDVKYCRYTGGGNIGAWIAAACAAAGIPLTNDWVKGYTTLCQRESSLNPNAVNKTDSNATGPTVQDGNPRDCSRGVAQCIPATFARYHVAGTSAAIYDPVANIAASIQYVRGKYHVSSDGSDLSTKVQQADPNRSPKGY